MCNRVLKGFFEINSLSMTAVNRQRKGGRSPDTITENKMIWKKMLLISFIDSEENGDNSDVCGEYEKQICCKRSFWGPVFVGT